jgi:hypothetical protein
LGPVSLVDQGSHLPLVEHITGSEVGFASGDALLSRYIGEQLPGSGSAPRNRVEHLVFFSL